MFMKLLTIYTSTYNRANTIGRTYESLLKQTNKNFEWIIVDDGSTDNTYLLVNKWTKEGRIPIKFVRKENGGLHTGYNTAIELINTELCMSCDSDDYLPENAVEIIQNVWSQYGNNNLAGIIGLDFYSKSKKPIGGYFNNTSEYIHFLDLKTKLNHDGDVKMVHRTELLKQHVPMPSFGSERNFNPIYLFLKIDPNLNYILINENLCFVDYQATGMSANILRQFRNSPKSFGELRKVRLGHPRIPSKRKFIDAAHLVSSTLLAKDIKVLKNTPQMWRVLLSIPLGLCFWAYILYQTRE